MYIAPHNIVVGNLSRLKKTFSQTMHRKSRQVFLNAIIFYLKTLLFKNHNVITNCNV